MGCSPCVIPPLIHTDSGVADICASSIVERLCLDILEAKNNMLQAKISQSLATNEHHSNDFPFRKGDHVILSTLYRQQDYKSNCKMCVAKFMPHYNGPYEITNTAPEISTITINLPNHPNFFLTFHTSQV
jgi:hypothetical protein